MCPPPLKFNLYSHGYSCCGSVDSSCCYYVFHALGLGLVVSMSLSTPSHCHTWGGAILYEENAFDGIACEFVVGIFTFHDEDLVRARI
jgi:hypothetical protein